MLYPLSYEGAAEAELMLATRGTVTLSPRGAPALRGQAGSRWVQSLLSLVYGVVIRTLWMPKSTRTATSCSIPTTEPSP